MRYLDAFDFLEEEHIPLIDVRSPAEFEQGHIPEAINIPLFSNEERAEVGTLYKNTGRRAAIQKGMEIVGPKINAIAERAIQLAIGKKLRVHCWRGGMRSENIAQLMDTLGIDSFVLRGGYKAYRQHLQQCCAQASNLWILDGATGAGKTEILHELEKFGEQVIDLEGLANHRGSSFGGIGLGDQPTTEHFQNTLFQQLRKMDPKRPLWLEAESLNIGKVHLPEGLWGLMNKGSRIEIQMDRSFRVDRLVRVYGVLNMEEISIAIRRIEKRLGGQLTQMAMKAVEEKDLEKIAHYLLSYYDRSYQNARQKNMVGSRVILTCPTGDAHENAKLVLAQARKLIPLSHDQ